MCACEYLCVEDFVSSLEHEGSGVVEVQNNLDMTGPRWRVNKNSQ